MKRLLFLLPGLLACTQVERPLDAKERLRIDSIANTRIHAVRVQIDSQCRQAGEQELPRLVDSMLAERRREIQDMLKNVPR